MESSPTFDVLRPRPDFQLLLQDFTFPSWPFGEDVPSQREALETEP
jgi:hypothetical protein